MLTKIFCDIDDFMKLYTLNESEKLFIGKSRTKLNFRLSLSEVMTIVVYYHNAGNRTFKDFYTKFVCKNLQKSFPNLVSYNRFIELMKGVLLPLVAFLKLKRLVKSEAITFIDSTKIKVCHNKRIKRNRTFEGIATIGKSTMGWFFGFKLHIAINENGELCGASVSKANVDDRDEKVLDAVLKDVTGKLYADKGYISKKLFEALYEKGITLVTSVKKNMKNRLLEMVDKILLRKRSIIETVNDQLKNMCDIEHTRHRSHTNAMVNLIAGLIRYTYFEKKPTITFSTQESEFIQKLSQIDASNNLNKAVSLV